MVAARDGAEVRGSRYVVATKENAQASDADEDAGDLEGVIFHVEEEKRDDHNDDDGPEIDQLSLASHISVPLLTVLIV